MQETTCFFGLDLEADCLGKAKLGLPDKSSLKVKVLQFKWPHTLGH